MRLAVFGDSFATGDLHPKSVSWPRELSKILGCPHDVFALGGSPLYYSYENFLKNYENYTHIVFVYTEFMRLNILPKTLARFSNIRESDLPNLDSWPDIDSVDREALTALIKARRYLDRRDFNLFVYQGIFDRINLLCEKRRIRLVNIHPFDTPSDLPIDLSERKGNCLLNLLEVSSREIGNSVNVWSTLRKVKDAAFLTLIRDRDIRPNHLNNHNNIALANIIYGLFDNKIEPLDLMTREEFSFDKNIVLDMLSEHTL